MPAAMRTRTLPPATKTPGSNRNVSPSSALSSRSSPRQVAEVPVPPDAPIAPPPRDYFTRIIITSDEFALVFDSIPESVGALRFVNIDATDSIDWSWADRPPSSGPGAWRRLLPRTFDLPVALGVSLYARRAPGAAGNPELELEYTSDPGLRAARGKRGSIA